MAASKYVPLPIPGYTYQSDAKVGLVSKNKLIEEQLLRLIDILRKDKDIDGRWLSIARTHFEQGFMALNRSIFKPERIKLPGDPE